jgi:cold shock protein
MIGTEMPSGSVKWFDPIKGYGFIVRDDGGPDVFVHVAQLERCGLDALKTGDEVAFELVANRKVNKTEAAVIRLLAKAGKSVK